MPWTADSYKKRHNKKLTKMQAQKASDISNAIFRETGDEGKAIRVANSRVKKSWKGYR